MLVCKVVNFVIPTNRCVYMCGCACRFSSYLAASCLRLLSFYFLISFELTGSVNNKKIIKYMSIFRKCFHNDIHICKEMFFNFNLLVNLLVFLLCVHFTFSTETMKIHWNTTNFRSYLPLATVFCSLAPRSSLSLSVFLMGWVRLSFFCFNAIFDPCCWCVCLLRDFSRHSCVCVCVCLVDLKYLSAIYDHQTVLFTFIFMCYTHYLYSESVSNFYINMYHHFHNTTTWNGVSFTYFKWKLHLLCSNASGRIQLCLNEIILINRHKGTPSTVNVCVCEV